MPHLFEPDQRTATRALQPVRVLLVGSYQLLVKSLKQAFEEEGFVADIAAPEHDGTVRVPPVNYDIIIVDVMRPNDGDLSAVQRWHKADPKTRILVLTAPDLIDDTVHDNNVHIDDWIVKPFELEELFTRVSTLLRAN